MLKILITPTTALVIAMALILTAPEVLSDQIENRVILDEDFNWLTNSGADKLLNRINQAGFNVFVPVIWHGRGSSWPTKLAPREPLWEVSSYPGSDPLKYLIKKAHELGIQVHPWFTVVLRQREILTVFYDEGTPKKAFNIHMPGFRRYIVDLMLEVVKNYDVDGINLDYIRSMGICISNHCIDDYLQKTGGQLLEDVRNLRIHKKARTRISHWNAGAITDIVRTFSKQARSIKPDLIISVDTHPVSKSLALQGANSIEWANENLIDIVYDMQYQDTIDSSLFYTALQRLENPEKLVLMVGNFERSEKDKSIVWPRHESTVSHLIESGRELGQMSKTVALYEYRFLTDAQIRTFRNGPFKKKAVPNFSK